MDDAAFFEQLRSICSDSIEAYRIEYPDAPPLTEPLLPHVDGPLATEADVHKCFDELTHLYDELLNVDSTPYRESWREQLVYDCSLRERVALLTSDLPVSLTLVFIGGRYSGWTGKIGVSPGQLPEASAYMYLASELCHAYQHRFDSPTWNHPYLQEGFERAVSLRALAFFTAELQHEFLIHLTERQRTKSLLKGVLAHGTRQGGIESSAVRDLGVTNEELAELRSHWLWHPLEYLRPRYRWSAMAFLPEYSLFGSLLLVSETASVSSPYARAFQGNHPWESVISKITTSTPSWLWRLFHQ